LFFIFYLNCLHNHVTFFTLLRLTIPGENQYGCNSFFVMQWSVQKKDDMYQNGYLASTNFCKSWLEIKLQN
jgi:hypothetical protein